MKMYALLIFAICIGSCASVFEPGRLNCLPPARYRMGACLNTDPCCIVSPVFVNGCFQGCQVACHNSIFCERTCPVLTRFDIEKCVNSDPFCYVKKITEETRGRVCFRGCMMACQ
ncbi:uncharacterized protein LOC133190035 [Saccostrea echinata]|uniref:uncharacterized protein LOC133190035 n=1 Tax=Saccostrea echinata TaxID=191078 RepID=UPI002A7EB97E|nr:uncharacterized protein LOC133190035 [Saccostrea echinata]